MKPFEERAADPVRRDLSVRSDTDLTRGVAPRFFDIASPCGTLSACGLEWRLFTSRRLSELAVRRVHDGDAELDNVRGS